MFNILTRLCHFGCIVICFNIMLNEREDNMMTNPIIGELTDQIVAKYDPHKIIMFSHKLNVKNEITSFKICMVIETADKEQLEKDIYISIDCCMPYDIIIYTPNEWDRLLQIPHSFAEKVNASGVVLYDKTAN